MNILFIQMGGTIDKDYPKTTKGWAFEIGEPAVRFALNRLNPSFDYEIISICKKDSQEITSEDRLSLLKAIEGAVQDKIIITHGTDTLIETAQFLANNTDKLIILTGSMRPEKFKNSDADINLGLAIGGINVLKSGVYVAMNGLVISAHTATRDLSSGFFIKKP